ncbi:MAG: glycosyltransferase family 2 protein, partial [Candidatus Woesearchaeota archaeon]
MDNLWVVIAAYNEHQKINQVISSLINNNYKYIIVVDDGSKDNTADVAEKAGAIVLRHILNRGQGAALKTGIDYALKCNAEYIVTFDADGQHQANEIHLLIDPLVNHEADVCLGSRFLKNTSNVSWHRKCLLKAGAGIIWLFYGIHLTDSHNGFRAFTRDAIKKLNLKADRMEHASEILEQIAIKKLKYKEIPVTITYTEYSLQKG